ncbi:MULTISPECIES: hypothetical protein [unclassified Vibrio]|uniref:hypothetical protein n=1 Tax=unclassified Vibrio TaxID=2614977 RepID=UPI001EF080B5|nr:MULTISPECIES: hypothetical protein [unclassified Vibrio]
MDVTYQNAESILNLPVTNPAHLPGQPMAGCENPDPSLTQKSLAMVAKLRAQLAEQMPKKAQTRIPARFRAPQFRKQDEAPEMGADSSYGEGVA